MGRYREWCTIPIASVSAKRTRTWCTYG